MHDPTHRMTHCGTHQNPIDREIQKLLSVAHPGRVKATAVAKHYRECSQVLVFLVENWQETAQSKKDDDSSGKKKRAQRLTFWVRRPPGGVGGLPREGVVAKRSCPPSKVCLQWVSKRRIWDVPGSLPGCPQTLGGVQKVCAHFFRS